MSTPGGQGRPQSVIRLPLKRKAMEQVCREILQIMDTYHEQDASPRGIGTPGGLEHMGDVWRLLSRWERKLRAQEAP